jgi:hypothetical protein
MMMFHNTVRSLLFLSLLLSGNAETVRGVHRELEAVVDLGDAGAYAILAQTGISTVPSSVISGDIAVYGGTLAAITGFSLDAANSTSLQIEAPGKAYASDTLLLDPVSNIQTAYSEAKNRGPGIVNLASGLLSGVTLYTGVYTFTTNVQLTGDITFHGSDADIFIIQTTGNLIQDGAKKVILSGGALAKNIFWQVTGYVSVGVSAHMEGIILADTDVTFKTSSSLNGRIFSQTFVALQMATITEPAPP